MRLILASASPRRAELLRRLNAEFDIEISGADETIGADEDERLAVMDIARRKAVVVAERLKAEWLEAERRAAERRIYEQHAYDRRKAERRVYERLAVDLPTVERRAVERRAVERRVYERQADDWQGEEDWGNTSVGLLTAETIIIGADTVVIAPNGERLGKPIDRADAKRMLKSLSGKWHMVHTGLALVCAGSGREIMEVETTEVKFCEIDDSMIERYLTTGEFADKAGAYAIQGCGAVLVESIFGCYFNVMGLPISKLASMLRNCGYMFF